MRPHVDGRMYLHLGVKKSVEERVRDVVSLYYNTTGERPTAVSLNPAEVETERSIKVDDFGHVITAIPERETARGYIKVGHIIGGNRELPIQTE